MDGNARRFRKTARRGGRPVGSPKSPAGAPYESGVPILDEDGDEILDEDDEPILTE